jgi:nucleotide-binding universal stress UspA family protein
MKGTILLAVDHSKVAHRAAEAVADLAAAEHNPVVVMHVHQVAVGRFGRLVIEQEPDQGCVSEEIRDELRAAGVDASAVHPEVGMGHVAVEIARTADRLDATLIVMGSRCESDLVSLALGSVSHRVLHLAHRPTLLLPPE